MRQIRKTTTALMLTMAGGMMACGAAPGEGTEESVGETAQATTTYTTAQLQAAQRAADVVSWAIITRSTAGLPTTAACKSLVPDVQSLITQLNSGSILVNGSPVLTTIQGLAAGEVTFKRGTDANQTVVATFQAINNDATSCWGGPVANFIFWSTQEQTANGNADWDIYHLDPGVATLSTALSATAGASAAAAWSDTPGSSITVYQLPNKATTVTGLPSGPTTNCNSIGQAVPAGQNVLVTGYIIQNSAKSYQCSA